MVAQTAPTSGATGTKYTKDDIDELLDKYDKNGDGRFNREEVRRILFDIRGLQRRNKQLIKFVFLLFVLIIAVLAATFGVVMVANEASKESKVPQGGTEMRTLDGAVVATDAAETVVASLWDLPALDAAQLGYLKTMRVAVDMTSAPSGAWVDASFKLSSAYKPIGSATHATLLTYEGHTITIDGASRSGQIVMGGLVYPVADEAPASARRLDEESFIPAPKVYSPFEWAALHEKDTTKNGRRLRGAASLSTTGSFTLSAGGGNDK